MRALSHQTLGQRKGGSSPSSSTSLHQSWSKRLFRRVRARQVPTQFELAASRPSPSEIKASGLRCARPSEVRALAAVAPAASPDGSTPPASRASSRRRIAWCRQSTRARNVHSRSRRRARSRRQATSAVGAGELGGVGERAGLEAQGQAVEAGEMLAVLFGALAGQHQGGGSRWRTSRCNRRGALGGRAAGSDAKPPFRFRCGCRDGAGRSQLWSLFGGSGDWRPAPFR